MNRDAVLAPGETYHIYNRGAHKQDVFLDPFDYDRFLVLLHLANNAKPIQISNVVKKYGGATSIQMLKESADHSLVDVLAYCLMPNHYHLVLKQKSETGIADFMQRVGTGYSMYFNARHDHSGVLFQGRFKSRHLADESYYRYIFAYVHLNPLALVEPNWEIEGIRNKTNAEEFMRQYQHSSYFDYCIGNRLHKNILSLNEAPGFVFEQDDFSLLLEALEGQEGNMEVQPPYFS